MTDDKSIVYGTGEKEVFSDMMHTKVEDSDNKETETFIGYNDNQVMFIQDQGRAYYRKMLSSESIQKFERENVESPVLMFSVGDTTGFIDGRKVRVSNKNGELSTFELEEDIQSADIKNGYVLINGNILCCGMRYKQYKWDREEKILPFCQKINNLEKMELFMEEHDNIQKDSFIESENGCLFIEGLTEEEKLRTYKEYGFKELHAELEATIIKRQREEARKKETIRQMEENRKIDEIRNIEETRKKTDEYLEGKLLSICHIRRYSSRVRKNN